MPATKTFALAPSGLMVAVLDGARIVEQVPRGTNTWGKFDAGWRPVTREGLLGKIVEIAVRYDGALRALTGAGGLYALDKTSSGYAKSWRHIDPPGEEL